MKEVMKELGILTKIIMKKEAEKRWKKVIDPRKRNDDRKDKEVER